MIEKKRVFNVAVFAVIFTIFLAYSNTGFSAEPRKKVVAKFTYYRPISDHYTFSPDNKWLIFLPSFEKNALLMINMEEGRERKITYLDDVFEKSEFGFNVYWENNARLILKGTDTKKYYSLEIGEEDATIRHLKNFDPTDTKLISLYYQKDGIFYMGSSVDKRDIAKKLPEFKFEEGKTSIVYYNNIRVTSHEAKKNKFFGTIQYPYLHGVSISPNKKYILYCVSWSGGTWSTGPRHLYLLDTESKKVVTVDEHFMGSSPLTMIWSPDSKKFVYLNTKDSEKKMLNLIEVFL